MTYRLSVFTCSSCGKTMSGTCASCGAWYCSDCYNWHCDPALFPPSSRVTTQLACFLVRTTRLSSHLLTIGSCQLALGGRL